MPDKPIVLKITDAIASWLEGITVANGYAADVKVTRWTEEEATLGDNHLIVQPDNPVLDGEVPDSYEPDLPIKWRQPFRIIASVREPNRSPVPLDARLQVLRADIERRLAQADPTWGGLAHRTIPDNPEFHFDVRPTVVVIKFDVIYSTLRSDPRKQLTFS